MTAEIRVVEARPLFTVKTLARYLACSERQVRVYIAAGSIKSFKLGQQLRVEWDEAQRFVNEQKGEAA